MDFQNIFKEECDAAIIQTLFKDKSKIRKDTYVILSNSICAKERCEALKKSFQKCGETMIIKQDAQNEDILQALMDNSSTFIEGDYAYADREPVKFTYSLNPLFTEIKLECHIETVRVVAKEYEVNCIGRQHVLLTTDQGSDSYTSTDSQSDSSSSITSVKAKSPRKCVKRRSPAKKQKTQEADETEEEENQKENEDGQIQRTCQIEKTLDLEGHQSNCEVDTKSFCRVDIVILIESQHTNRAAKHLGLILYEELVRSQVNLGKHALNPKAKMHKFAQRLFNKKLIDGYSSILVTKDLSIWRIVRANARAIIVTDPFKDLAYNMHKRDSNYFVVAQDDMFSVIEAIGQIISKTLLCDITIPLKYEMSGKVFTMVNIPITTVIPLYIMRFFIQSYITKNTNMTLVDTDLFQMRKQTGGGDN